MLPALNNFNGEELRKALMDTSLNVIVSSYINMIVPSPESKAIAQKIYELIDDLLTRYIELVRTEDDPQGQALDVLHQHYAQMKALADKFSLGSYFKDWWDGRPAVRQTAKLFLDKAFNDVREFIKDPRGEVPILGPSIIDRFKKLITPLSVILTDQNITSSMLNKPFAQLARSWRWYQAVGGQRTMFSLKIWNIAVWFETIHTAQDLLREREANADTSKQLEQNVWNALASLDDIAITKAEKAYVQDYAIKPNGTLSSSRRSTKKFLDQMKQAENDNDKNSLRATLQSDSLRNFVQWYARREEFYEYPPARAYDADERKGAKKLYGFIDMLLRRFVQLLGKDTITQQDMRVIEQVYTYLVTLDTEYGWSTSWFAGITQPEPAQARIQAEENLRDALAQAVVLVQSQTTVAEIDRSIQTLTDAYLVYKTVGGSSDMPMVVITQLQKKKNSM